MYIYKIRIYFKVPTRKGHIKKIKTFVYFVRGTLIIKMILIIINNNNKRNNNIIGNANVPIRLNSRCP